MITVQEAKAHVYAATAPLATEQKELMEAVGYVLATSVRSSLPLPSFRQSSMDGYALHHDDLRQVGDHLPVVAESRAGSTTPLLLKRGTAVHILTGAPVPEGATAVVMQEQTERQGDTVTFLVPSVREGQNVRAIGQQIQPGEIALKEGTLLTPGSVGFLAGMNVQAVEVYRKPSVGILVTGDELVPPGNELLYGQVHESNSLMLEAALRAEGIRKVDIRYVPDDARATSEALLALAEQFDVVLTTGGISVGEYDYIGRSLNEIGVEKIFYKVRQRPGKPLFFGKRGTTLVFGLPGNPAASLVCFYEYVLPALRRMYGRPDAFLPTLRLPVTQGYSFQGERDEFLKATATASDITPLEGQESFVLRSFAMANALIYLPVSQRSVAPGDLVEAHLLPFFC